MYDDELPCGFGEEAPPVVMPLEATMHECCESCSCEQCKCKVPIPVVVQPNPNRKTKVCFKCKVNPGALLHKNQPMCRQCSLRNVEYKCRVNMQTKIKIKQTDRLLVGVSGGMNSICLMNILKELEIRFQKHLLFETVEGLHIDTSYLWKSQKETVERLVRYSKERGFQLTIIPIESLYGNSPERLRQLIGKFKEGADEVDLFDIMVERLLIEHATKQNKLLVKGTCGQRVAASIFKTIIKGNGGNIGELSYRNGNILMPLRQHLSREMQFYYHCKQLDQYSFPQPTTNQPRVSHRLNDLLEDFIDTLQDTYSHTCPTILRTSQKIKLAAEGGSKCGWCLTPAPSNRCMRCTRLSQHWAGEQPLEKFLPACFSQ